MGAVVVPVSQAYGFLRWENKSNHLLWRGQLINRVEKRLLKEVALDLSQKSLLLQQLHPIRNFILPEFRFMA